MTAHWALRKALGPVLLLVAGWVVLDNSDPKTVSILIVALYYAAAATSFNFLLGQLGVFSLCQNLFMAVGGFTAVYLFNNHGVSPWLALPLAIAISGCLALPIALATVRAGAGPILAALITLIIAQAAVPVIISQGWLGGASGMYEKAGSGNDWGALQFVEPASFGKLLLVVNIILIAFMMWWSASRFGYYARATKDAPEASEAVGIPTASLRVWIFVIAAMMATPVGLLYAQYNLLATADLYLGTTPLFQVVIVALVGGAAASWGPIAGGLVIAYLSQFAGQLGGSRPGVTPLAFAVAFFLLAVLMPRGLSGTWAQLRDWWTRGRSAAAAPGSPAEPAGRADENVTREIAVEGARHGSGR